MLSITYKDIIKLSQPVKACVHIKYSAPYTEGKKVLLEPGQILQVSPFLFLNSSEFEFRCLSQDESEFKKKYFKESEDTDSYYNGFSISILEEHLKDCFEIVREADLSNLDIYSLDDQSIFCFLFIQNPEDERLNHLPDEIRSRFLLVMEAYSDMLITENEVYNQCLEILSSQYRYRA